MGPTHNSPGEVMTSPCPGFQLACKSQSLTPRPQASPHCPLSVFQVNSSIGVTQRYSPPDVQNQALPPPSSKATAVQRSCLGLWGLWLPSC